MDRKGWISLLAKIEKALQNYQSYVKRKNQIHDLEEQTKKSFHSASLFLTHITYGNVKTYIYPTIQKTLILETHKEIIFTIPKGMNPKNLTEKEYVFKQYLGDSIELEIGSITCVIRIFPKRMKSVNYSFNELLVRNELLPVIVGQNKYNQWIKYSLITSPNTLISGVPGSGKSSMLRTILTTWVLMKKPHELEMYLVDLKKSEFHIFENIEHVKAVCDTPGQFKPIMKKLMAELDKRGNLLKKYGVSHINDIPASERPGFIVLVIDEVIVLKKEKEITEDLLQYACLGRAYGMFLILSMQRPCNKSLDTAIRAILNARLGFRSEDKTNSDISGTPGAENIPSDEPGRMIFKIDADSLQEVQAPFLSVEEAKKLLSPFKRKDDTKGPDCSHINKEKDPNTIFGLMED